MIGQGPTHRVLFAAMTIGLLAAFLPVGYSKTVASMYAYLTNTTELTLLHA